MSENLRPIEAVPTPNTEPGMSETPAPVFEYVDPRTLMVDGTYQREMGDRSRRLILRIVTRWDWRRFRPPVVARRDGKLLIIDGQHTAIAAATHPMIDTIPVQIVSADEVASQAEAFVGLNCNRLNLTPMQIHVAGVAAGNEDALTIEKVCERAGVKMLRQLPSGGHFKARECCAPKAVDGLICRRGAKGARIILQVLADAEMAPVSAEYMRAVEHLLYDAEYRGMVDPEEVTAKLLDREGDIHREARTFAAAHGVPVWRGLSVRLFQVCKKRRRAANGETAPITAPTPVADPSKVLLGKAKATPANIMRRDVVA